MPNFIDPFASGGLGDPIGQGIVPPPPAGGQPMFSPEEMNQPITGTPPIVPMLQQPTMSERLINAGLAMIAADQAGLGLGGSLAAGMQGYHKTLEDHREKQRKDRHEQLAEWELMGRIKERQMTEQQMAKRATMLERLKKENPDLADMIELDPEMAAKTIAAKMTPKTPFEGTGMEAQINNILLTGDPASPAYLAAYNLAKQPKTQVNPATGELITITPDMSAYNPPAFTQGVGGAGAAPVASNGASTTQNIGGTTLVTSPPTKKAPLTEVAAKAVYAADRMENAENMLAALPQEAENAGSGRVNSVAAAVSAIPSMGLGDAIGEGIRMYGYSSDEKKYRNLANEWNTARLRQESGAVISKEELEQGFKQYFPQPNDDDDVTAQKAALRANAIKVMRGVAESGQSKPIVATPTGSPAGMLGIDKPAMAGGGGMLDDAATAAPATPKTAADFAALPSGALFINPKDGKVLRKK